MRQMPRISGINPSLLQREVPERPQAVLPNFPSSGCLHNAGDKEWLGLLACRGG
jgi:hypothetical protein